MRGPGLDVGGFLFCDLKNVGPLSRFLVMTDAHYIHYFVSFSGNR